MANLRQLLLIAFVCSACASFAAKAPRRVVKKKAAAKKPAPKPAPKPVARKAPRAAPAPAPRPVAGISNAIGVLPPLGYFDPLGIATRGPEVYRRYQEMEIKHGRMAMAGCLGVITTEAGLRLPGYISFSQDLKFSDIGGSLSESYFGVPLAGWAQMVAFVACFDIAVLRQDPKNAPGDVARDLPFEWIRYSDPKVKTFKLNAERQNGRAAMMGIMGMISHSALGEDALFPLVQ